MPKADKRERQRQNRDARRAELQAVEKRRKQRRTTRNLAFLLLPVVVLFVVLQVTSGSNSSSGINRTYSNSPGKVVKERTDYSATIDTTEGEIVVSLDVANSIVPANNFVFLARHKFYDGLRFSRVVKDTAIETGSPNNTTSGGPGYTTLGEPPITVAGEPAYPVGTVAMANNPNKSPAGSFGSRFFIVTGAPSGGIPLQFAVVGKVTSGLDVAQKIGLLYPKSGDGKPTKTVTIRKVTITSTPAASTTSTAPPTTAAP